MKIILAGAGGMLGSALRTALPAAIDGADVVKFGRADLTVSRPRDLLDAVAAQRPSLVINAAAHTDVEGSESDPASAFAANAELPGLLAGACRNRGIPLIHISSTGCYGNWKDEPYIDYDPVHPTTVHHRSKIAGEQAVVASGAEHLIIRTGWLFGGDAGQAKNFVFKRVLEALNSDVMRSDPTQRGNPTFVDDLAQALIRIFTSGVRGTCNLVSGGSATRLEYVREIVKLSGLPCRVEPSDGGFPRRARVSPNEAADNFRLRLLGLDGMDPWQDQLARYIASLRETTAWRESMSAIR